MILMVNGLVVGGRTESEVEIEISTSGPVLNLVISRYKHGDVAAEKFAAMEQKLLHCLDSATDDGRLIGWREVGDAREAHFVEGKKSVPTSNDDDQETQGVFQNTAQESKEVDIPPEDLIVQSPTVESPSTTPHDEQPSDWKAPEADDAASHQSEPDDASSSTVNPPNDAIRDDQPEPEANTKQPPDQSEPQQQQDDEDEEDWDEDENAWLGCVCGEIHTRGDGSHGDIFWIQCESCSSWYDVSSNCVGFGMDEAVKIKKWICWACPGSSLPDDSCQKAPPCARARADNESHIC